MNQKPSKQTVRLDWSDLRNRLSRVQETMHQGFVPTHEEKKEILKSRARSLARKSAKKETAESYLEVVEFILAGERYGIETTYIREVYPLKELTPLPCTPPYVLGIINVHGQIISVIDIKKFFDLPAKGITDLNKVIIIYTNTPVLNETVGMEFGILADAILGVKSIPLEEIQPSLPTLTGIRDDYLKGITRERAVILDAEKILTDRNIIVHEDV